MYLDEGTHHHQELGLRKNDRQAELYEEANGRSDMWTLKKFRMGRPSSFLGDLCRLRMQAAFAGCKLRT